VFAYATTREPAFAPIVVPLAVLGGLLLLFVLVRGTDDLLGWALFLAGAAYAAATLAHGTHVDEAAPLVGVALLLCGEQSAWSLDERRPIARDRGVLALRAVAVAALAAAGLGIAALVVALSISSLGGGLAWTAVGAAAVVGVVALVARVARG
jgi:hypothetical protein